MNDVQCVVFCGIATSKFEGGTEVEGRNLHKQRGHSGGQSEF